MSSKFLAAQTEAAQSRMAQLVKRLVGLCKELAQENNGTLPDKVFFRYLDLLEVIAGRSTYVSLLTQYPPVCEKVARVLMSSEAAAEYQKRLSAFCKLHTPLY